MLITVVIGELMDKVHLFYKVLIFDEINKKGLD